MAASTVESRIRGKRIRLILQEEVAECGFACMLMLANSYANRSGVSLKSFKRMHVGNASGASMLSLKILASNLGLRPRVFRMDAEVALRINRSFIAHWDHEHYVVVEHQSRRGIVIHDPALGTSRIGTKQFANHFTGYALLVDPEHTLDAESLGERIDSPVRAMMALLAATDGAAVFLTSILLLGLGIEALALSIPLMTKHVIDLLVGARQPGYRAVFGMAAWFIAVVVLQASLLQVRFHTLARIAAVFNLSWATRTVGHLFRLPMQYFERRRIADVASRISSIESIQRTIATSLVSSGLDGLMAVTGLLFMAYYSVSLSLIVAVGFATYVCMRVAAQARLATLTSSRVAVAGRSSVEMLETLRSIQAFKLAGLEEMRTHRYLRQVRSLQLIDFRTNRINSGMAAGSFLITNMQRVALLTVTFILVSGGSISIGAAMACIALAEQFVGRGPSFVDRVVELRLLGAHLDRLADITASPEEDVVRQQEGGGRVQPERPCSVRIRAKNLGYRHAEDGEWLFRNINFDILPGQCALLDGPSGAGKTTLLKIMLGLLKPSEGSLCIDEAEIGDWDTRRYRSICSTVMQDDCVIAGSIADNIRFFSESDDRESVEDAARLANVHEEIQRLPLGYNTRISDLDGTLSGGQRQRVLLARAIYRNGALLVLDEAFSHLDADNRKGIGAAIASLGMTRVVVSHTEHEHYQPDQVLSVAGDSPAMNASRHLGESMHHQGMTSHHA